MGELRAEIAERRFAGVPLAVLGREAAGAFAATVAAMPQILSLGAIAFAALGPKYAGAGIAAALLASIVGNVAALPLYAARCQIVGARSSGTALFAGFIAMVAVHPAVKAGAAVDVPAVMALAMLVVAGAGLLQLAMGLAGVGRAIKYVPYPVIAGFMNAVAVLLAIAQVRPVLGLPGQAPLAQTFGQLHAAHWGGAVTAATTLAAIFVVKRAWPRFPILLGGLLAGTVVHYAIALAAPASLGPVVGPLPTLLPEAEDLRAVAKSLATFDLGTLCELVLPYALLLAVVSAIDGLVAAAVCDGVTRGRHDSDRVLMGQGLANLAGGFVGALPAALNTHTPIASYQSGARTGVSTALHSLFVLALVVALAPAAAALPTAALAGIMLYIAYSLADRWSGDLLRRLKAPSRERVEVAFTVAIVIVVATAQIALNVMYALAIGVFASMLLLVVKLSGSPVRRRLDGASRSSHKIRSPQARDALRGLAHRIRILELQGEIFFGTADRVQSEVESLPDDIRVVILDFRRVHQIDATGGRTLETIGHRASMRGLHVIFAHVRPEDRRGRYLRALGIDGAIPKDRWFADLDRALEWSEDLLLEQSRFAEAADELPLAQMQLFQGFAPEEMDRVAVLLERVELGNGDPVFHEGDEGDRLYLIAQGAVSIKVRLDRDARARRLATFTPGVMFGEMALLEGKRRSADAFAKGERVVLWALTHERFHAIEREDPHLGTRIHQNLARELAARLRATSDALRALE